KLSCTWAEDADILHMVAQRTSVHCTCRGHDGRAWAAIEGTCGELQEGKPGDARGGLSDRRVAFEMFHLVLCRGLNFQDKNKITRRNDVRHQQSCSSHCAADS